MSIVEDYRKQYRWRSWQRVYQQLPLSVGDRVLDLGCGVGDQAMDLAMRGARVVGIDGNREFIDYACGRKIEGAEFHVGNLIEFEELPTAEKFDGIWSSFTAAYFVQLDQILARWSRFLKPGGWIAISEIDDLFGHEPIANRTRELFEAYGAESLKAGRYDFRMGRKLRNHLERSHFKVISEITIPDQELAFEGPALPEVLHAWETRLDRMRLLHEFCGTEFESLQDDFLECLRRSDHHSNAKVICCVARIDATA